MTAIESERVRVMQKPAQFAAVFEEKLGIKPAAAADASAAAQPYTDSAAAQTLANSSALQKAVTLAQANTGTGLTQQAQPYMQLIQNASAEYNIPVNLILGVIKAESDFDPNSVSYAGAKGLMQLMPANCAEDGVTDPFDPAQNINAGTAEIARFLSQYNGDVKLALAAYNTGPGNLEKRNVLSSQSPEYQTVPQVVRDYVDRVLRYAGYES